MRFVFVLLTLLGLLVDCSSYGNIPGGGSGTGPNVTLTDNGTTVTIANGIVSIVCTKSGASINQINYTYNNGSGTQTTQLLSGGHNGGQLYWEVANSESLSFTNAIVSDPAGNGGDYAEIALTTHSVANIVVEVHFSMLRGSTGFYVTAIYFHRSTDGAFGMGECRDNIYAGSIFDFMSVDAARNRLMSVSTSAVGIGVLGAPAEVSLWTNGIYAGRYEDKYCYSADLGVQRVWGWSNVGAGGKNVGLWNISASAEYYNGGPMKRELMEHIGTTVLNMLNGGHYGGGQDGNFAANEVWTKVYGPYFIYCNNVTNTITDPTQAAADLYADALAQGDAEGPAWPYAWFTNANYIPAAGRGTVTGTVTINDSYNPNASPSNLWVGLVQQPISSATLANGASDFQTWVKPYQFWTKTDGSGNFSIPNVIPGANYTVYAFGPGAAGTYQSQSQSGGNGPNTVDIPASPVSVAVTAGSFTGLGVVWTPTRVGPAVFEIGYPNRIGDKFRHGDDYWVGDIGPATNAPSPFWSKHLEYPFEFPSGPSYTVGTSRWTTDWDYVQPVVANSAGAFSGSTSTITFSLSSVGSAASFYIALSSDYQGPLIIQVNGNNIAGSTGYFPNYSGSSQQSDTTIRQAVHGMFSDARFTVPTSALRVGQNTITINMRKGDNSGQPGSGWENHAMYDYIRLEMAGYIPPAPSSVAAYAGSNCVFVSWPVTPGAISYSILRSTTSGSGYSLVTNGITGPVCGSGLNNATFLDSTAANGVTYYYVVQSVNTVGASANSPQSAGVTPSAGSATSPPAAPASLSATVSHGTVNLSWAASTGANFYTIQRSTIVDNGYGSYVTLSTIPLNNATTGTSFTDSSVTDGTTYSYSVSAANAAGVSSNSAPFVTWPLPSPPASAPGALTSAPSQGTNIVLSWSAVSGAVGYVLQRATSANGAYLMLGSITELSYTDIKIGSNGTYYYKVTAMNAAGTSGSSFTTTKPAAPTNLVAVATNTQITLTWPPSIGATGYIVSRGTVSGNDTNVISSGISATNYTDSGLSTGTRYYYVVAAIGSAATSGNSVEASAATVPVTPTGLSASPGLSQVVLGWNLCTNASGYNVKRSTTNGGPYVMVASAVASTAYTNTGLANGTTYYYVVSATNSAGESANSGQASATLVSSSPPQVTSVISGGVLILSWPADHLGWRLEAQTNSTGSGLNAGWVTAPGSTSTNQIFIPFDARQGSVFFRLIYP